MLFKYRFSVIMPIYNLEKYVEESIDCIIRQTVGFTSCIQLILVNDGSRDRSGEICQKYADAYPDNVIYIDQPNGGVSAARNNGLKQALGKYILFFDGDDLLPDDAFEIAGDFFDAHYDEIDLLACRQAFFEAKSGFHSLDYKFRQGDRIIDINEEPDHVHMSVTSAFIKAKAMENRCFDQSLSIGEDSKLAMQIILDKEKYGVLKSVVYKIRRRDDGTSATQNTSENKSRYVETITNYYEYVAKLSLEKYGRIIPYVQHCIINGLKFRIIKPVPEILEGEEQRIYIEKITALIKELDDEVLLNARNANLNYRLYFLALKDEDAFKKHISVENGKVFYKGEFLEEITGANVLNVDELHIFDDYAEVAGHVNVPLYCEKFGIFADVNGRKHEIETDVSEEKKSFNGDTINHIGRFKWKFKLENCVNTINLTADFDGAFRLLPLGTITESKVVCECSNNAAFVQGSSLTIIAGKKSAHGDESLSLEGDNFFRFRKTESGKASPYIQSILLGEYSDLLADTSGDLDRLKGILAAVDDKNILGDKNIKWWHRINAYNAKHNTNIIRKLSVKPKGIYFKDTRVTGLKNTNLVRINLLNIKGGRIMLEGMTRLEMLRGCTLYLKVNDKRLVKMDFYDRAHLDRRDFAEDEQFYGKNFRVDVSLKNVKSLKFVLVKKASKEEFEMTPSFGPYAKLSRGLDCAYFAKGKYILTVDGTALCVKTKGGNGLFRYEKAVLAKLFSEKKYALMAYRIGAFLKKKFKKKEIWIISDRTDKARDNGEALFEYICKIAKPTDKKVYFTIDRDSADYARMAKLGPVLETGSWKLKLNWLCADKLISSQQSSFFLNMFADDAMYMKDLYKYEFSYIQHGITAGDFSAIFNKQRNNISLYCSAAEGEYDSLINGRYGYQESDVKLTGMARYDWLENNTGKQLVICPTWRQNLAAPMKPGSSERMYSESFKESEFFKFYNGLINDPKLMAAMEKAGYTGIVSLHPAQKAQIRDFTENAMFKINDGSISNNKLFAESALMITDYSSASFDFAYLKKPVVYTQFDYDEFFSTHTANQGFYEYDRDGFGPVCRDLDETVEAIIQFMENDCRLEGEYLKRVEGFYRYFDRDNSKRIYEAIL